MRALLSFLSLCAAVLLSIPDAVVAGNDATPNGSIAAAIAPQLEFSPTDVNSGVPGDLYKM